VNSGILRSVTEQKNTRKTVLKIPSPKVLSEGLNKYFPFYVDLCFPLWRQIHLPDLSIRVTRRIS